MAMVTSTPEAWISVLIIFAVVTVLVANAILLHGSSQRKGGRFVRPLLRHAVGTRGRSRSRSASLTAVSAMTTTASPDLEPPEEEWVEAAARWVLWDPNPTTREVVQSWIASGDRDSAKRAFMGKRLAFGTSGIRGTMGPGFCRINDLVVIQTTQGLCRYLEQAGGEEFKARGVVIGRDHRRQGGLSSVGFADLAAAVFVSRGFRVYLMDGVVATPLVAFGVSHLEACAGVMITASHNPKKDNGYKVYWGNGSQIIPPHDAGIAASIERNLEPWQTYDPASAKSTPLCSDPTEAITEAYYNGIKEGLCRRPEANARSGLEVVYSAMHGVGDAWARLAFRCFSLPPLISVGCQQEPDPEFPTVAFPNPEEQGALKEAMLLAEERGVSLVLANDPDGDRLAAAERQPSGEWHVLSGNEIGVLLGVWQWQEWRRTHTNDDPSNAVMIASTVSSKMLSAVAAAEGFTFVETLPGFKWMGHLGQQLKAEGKTILFAYEEAIGFGPGDVVFEKDGLSSAALFAEMMVALRDQDESEATAAAAAVASATATPPASTGETPPLPLTSTTTTTTTQTRTPLSDALNTTFPAEKRASNAEEQEETFGSTAPSSPYTETASPPWSPIDPAALAAGAGPSVEAFAAGDVSAVGASDASVVVSGAMDVAVVAGSEKDLWRRGFSSVLTRRLQALHARYGEFAEENGYVRCEDTEVVSKIFDRLRGDGSYRSTFGGYKVTAVRDLSEGHGFDSEAPGGRPTLPLVGGGPHFVTFRLGEEGVVATFRTSGTEPKIKFYLEMQGQPGVPLDQVSSRLSEIAEVLIEEALEPKRWGIKRVALA